MAFHFVLTAFDAPLTVHHAVVRDIHLSRHVAGPARFFHHDLPDIRNAAHEARLAATAAGAEASIAANTRAAAAALVLLPDHMPKGMATWGWVQTELLGTHVTIGDVIAFNDMRIRSAGFFDTPVVLNHGMIDDLVADVKAARRMADNSLFDFDRRFVLRNARDALPKGKALRAALLPHVGKICFIGKK